jgi:hypothetical protein
MAHETAVFISYARTDGEPFANELRQRLQKEPDIALWQDRIRMAPGDFEEQIRKAINSAEYLVVVITPGALRSEWVEKEWRYARENGVCICPVKPRFQSPSIESELKELLAKWPALDATDPDFRFRRVLGATRGRSQEPLPGHQVAIPGP